MTRARLKRGYPRFRSASILLAVAFWGCGDDADPSGVTCGAGTQIQGDQCVAIGGTVDGGSDPDGGAQVLADTGTVVCGAGTTLTNGQCVATPGLTLTCGAGTVLQDSTCVIAPPAAASIQGLAVSHVALRSQGALLDEGAQLNQFYPVEVSIGLTYTGDKAEIPVVFALGEVPASEEAAADPAVAKGFCLVGGFTVSHPGGATPTESIASGTMYIPQGCLKPTEQGRTVGPLVMIDPDGTVAAADPEAVSRSVAFLKLNADDPELAGCRRDSAATGAKGTCQIELKVGKSPGLDFELAELTLESSVAVLDRCADDWASIASGSAGIDLNRPVSYRCNHTIVPEFKRDGAGEVLKDSEGAPIQATYTNDQAQVLPKWVYGAADIDVDVTVISHGQDDSLVKNSAEVTAAGGDQRKLTRNVLAEHGLQIVYHVRPANSDTPDWKPLYLHAEGEQAKAGEEGESGQTQVQFEETEVVPATPHYYTHGLYVENDCGERNLETCNPALNPRTDIIYGAWANETDFVVRACLTPVTESGAPDAAFDINAANNCKQIPIKVVRHDTTGSTAAASSYGFNYQWQDGVGSQSTLRLGWDFHSRNNVTTAGVTVQNEAILALGSNLIGSVDILKGGASGAAYVSLVGSYYDYGLSAFGVKLWGDARVIGEFHYEKDWNVTKELKKGMNMWAGPVPLYVEIIFSGQAGLVANVDIIGVNAPFTASEESGTFLLTKATGSQRVGLATLSVTPYGLMKVNLRASVNGGGVRAGVGGELILLNLRSPLSGRLWWGMTNLSPVTLKMGAWADLQLKFTTMSGRIYLFAEQWDIKWCSKKILFKKVKYPCGEEWETFWDMTLANWGGWTWNQTLWASPYKEYTLP